MTKSMSFEKAVKELENIVSKLEDGELNLEDALNAFKEGIELSKYCSKILDNAEQTVNILIKEKNGEMEAKNFEFNEKE